ncbi:MAG TPA: sialidase family protein [Terriglobales bacterium]|nr:sialidase family protein [Terriglobales bacterium]
MKLAVVATIALMCAPVVLGSSEIAADNQVKVIVGPNVLVSPQTDGIIAELMFAVDPTNPMNVLGGGILTRAAFPLDGEQAAGRHGPWESVGFRSSDGGNSWKRVRYPELEALGGGDPMVAWGRTGTAYFMSLGESEKGKLGLLFYRSENSGATWSKVQTLPMCDHEQVVVDHSTGRFAGNVYVSALYGKRGEPGHPKLDYHVGVIRSHDDGRTWIGFVDVANNHDMPTRGINAMNPALFTDGELFVPYVEFPNDMPKGTTPELRERKKYHYWFATSKDGGATFSAPQKFKLQGGAELLGPFMIFPFFAIDNSNGAFRDRVYMVWADRFYSPTTGPQKYTDQYPEEHHARVMLSYSSDRGQTWSKPSMIYAGSLTAGDQFMPSVAVNNEGILAVSFSDTRETPAGRETPLVHRYLSVSLDGGENFLPPVRISSQPTYPADALGKVIGAAVNNRSISFTNGGGRVNGGDYLALATDRDGMFRPFWTDGRTGTYQVWTAAVRVTRPESNRPGHLDSASATAEPAPALVEADVSDKIEVWLDPLRDSAPAGALDLPVRLRNKSDQPIYGPIVVAVEQVTPDGSILNAPNGKTGAGAAFAYAAALRDWEALPAGGVSESIVWRIKAPAKADELPTLRFKVTARVRQAKGGATSQAER